VAGGATELGDVTYIPRRNTKAEQHQGDNARYAVPGNVSFPINYHSDTPRLQKSNYYYYYLDVELAHKYVMN
jgi:hypothetical protein